MAITSTCPHCGARQPVPDDSVGKTVSCQECNRPFDVLWQAATSPPSESTDVAAESTPFTQSRDDEPAPEASPSSDQKNAATGGSARERFDEVWAHARPWLQKAGQVLMRLVRRGLAGAATVAQFYGRNWRDLWEQARESSSAPEDSEQAEIRLSAHEDYENATWNGTRWDVRLPEQCVVCGEPTEGDRTEQVRSVPNLTWQLWAPFAGLGVGIVLGLFFWNKWLLPISIVVGFILGYLCRRETEVRVRFSRCGRHARDPRYPKLRFTPDLLVVLVGRRSVKLAFSGGKWSGTGVAVTPPPARRDEPAPIPLADEVHATVLQPPPPETTTELPAGAVDTAEVKPSEAVAESEESTAPPSTDSLPPPPAPAELAEEARPLPMPKEEPLQDRPEPVSPRSEDSIPLADEVYATVLPSVQDSAAAPLEEGDTTAIRPPTGDYEIREPAAGKEEAASQASAGMRVSPKRGRPAKRAPILLAIYGWLLTIVFHVIHILNLLVWVGVIIAGVVGIFYFEEIQIRDFIPWDSVSQTLPDWAARAEASPGWLAGLLLAGFGLLTAWASWIFTAFPCRASTSLRRGEQAGVIGIAIVAAVLAIIPLLALFLFSDKVPALGGLALVLFIFGPPLAVGMRRWNDLKRLDECPKCGHKLAEDAVICVSCGLDLRTGKKLSTEVVQQEDLDRCEICGKALTSKDRPRGVRRCKSCQGKARRSGSFAREPIRGVKDLIRNLLKLAIVLLVMALAGAYFLGRQVLDEPLAGLGIAGYFVAAAVIMALWWLVDRIR